ncbi:MAG TPA: hypothetical protein PKX87_07940, partial [Alphaproteobacteria bacterium]|nr:hypothetical protein [Alphaproteobacteria bacterium]
MANSIEKNEIYAITKVIADFVHPFGQAFEPLSPSEVEACGGMCEDGSWFMGLVTREPKVDEYKIVFNRKAAVCVYAPEAQRAMVLTHVFPESCILRGVLAGDGGPINPERLAVKFMQIAYSQSCSGETIVRNMVQNSEGEDFLSKDFTVRSPEELYHFLARMTLGVIEDLPDPAREVARILK